MIKVGKISGKGDILIVEEKQIDLIGDTTKRIPETTPRKIELEARRLKANKMRIKKLIEKEKNIIVGYWWKNILKFLTGEGWKKLVCILNQRYDPPSGKFGKLFWNPVCRTLRGSRW